MHTGITIASIVFVILLFWLFGLKLIVKYKKSNTIPCPGVFPVQAARRSGPDGELVAVNIQPQMIKRVTRRVQEAG
ncbi:MAG: hypothetical protein JXA13_14700 [Anaerolineales bacterium]|nr:hypothetical protein [Anaerolineales bacterium]